MKWDFLGNILDLMILCLQEVFIYKDFSSY